MKKKPKCMFLQPKARRRLPKEVAQQTRLKQHRRRVKALPTILDSIDKRCPASTRGCPWSRSCTVNLIPEGITGIQPAAGGNTRC